MVPKGGSRAENERQVNNKNVCVCVGGGDAELEWKRNLARDEVRGVP